MGVLVAPAILEAVQVINDDPALLPGHTMAWAWADDRCNVVASSIAASDLVETVKVDVVLGPSCSLATDVVSYWKHIPFVSWSAGAPIFSDKELYPNFVR